MTRILTFSSFLRTLPSLWVLGSLLSLGMGQTVRIPERVEVSTESISLGDIARIEPPSDQLSGFPLEQSNVNIVEEMINLIVSQRAYETSSRVVRSADEMYEQVNNLTR